MTSRTLSKSKVSRICNDISAGFSKTTFQVPPCFRWLFKSILRLATLERATVTETRKKKSTKEQINSVKTPNLYKSLVPCCRLNFRRNIDVTSHFHLLSGPGYSIRTAHILHILYLHDCTTSQICRGCTTLVSVT